jgi:UDPglucose 6-dehydrogenase
MIAIIGLGFVGLAAALGFAEKGYNVYGFDNNKNIIDSLNRSMVPFYEPGFDKILKKHFKKRFMIAKNIKEAIDNSQIIFYCVGTPNKEWGEADLTILKNAINATLKYIRKKEFKTLVIKSTVPPTTTHNVIKILLEKRGFRVGESIGLANNPEFLREGHALEDFIKPDRIVIGANDERSGKSVKMVYKTFKSSLYLVSLNTAEFIKYLSNLLLSSMISFSNEMSIIADKIGDIDIANSFRILHKDKRWYGKPAQIASYVYPGCGFGGYCLPKDAKALFNFAQRMRLKPKMIKGILEVNKEIKKYYVNKIFKQINKKTRLGILGLSFKPGSDDVRNTASYYIIKMLKQKGIRNIIAYDPRANKNFREKYKLKIKYAISVEEVARKSDVIVLLTAWNEFMNKKEVLKGKKVIDARYCLL